MEAVAYPELAENLRKTARFFGGAALAIGAVGFASWLAGVPAFQDFWPGGVTLKANAAIGFFLAGLSLWLQSSRGFLPDRKRPAWAAAQVCALMILLLGLATLGEYAGWSFDVDQLFFRAAEDVPLTSHPGRMSPNGATCFVMLGAALLLLDVRLRAAQLLSLLAGVVSALAMIGYLYGASALYWLPSYTGMTIYSAAAFLLLALGCLFARPGGLMSAVLDPTDAGTLLRRLLPAVILALIALGWMILAGDRSGLYDTAFAVAAMVVLSIAAVTKLIYDTAASLMRAERKRADAQGRLAESLALQRGIAEGSADAISAKDLQGRYLYINRAGARFLGRTPEEILGKTDEEVFGPEAGRRFREEDRRVVESGRPSFLEETITLAGSSRIYHSFKAPLQGEQGPIGVLGISRDITERKRMEAELVQARDAALKAARAKAEFLASMSHELRTPLNAVIGMTDIVLDTDLDPQQRGYIETVRNAGEALLSVINNILDFSKLESGKLVLQDTDFNLRDVLEGVVEILAPHAHGKGLELFLDLPPSLPVLLRGDPGRLRQVAFNLIGNAVKFTDHGEIVARARAEDGQLMIEVQDTGIGIAPELQERIFEAFTQGDSSSLTRRHEGTGLGLTISRKLVELMGGSMGVASQRGKGSTFWFRVPLKKQPRRGAGAARKDGLAGLRVLIVDDNPTNRTILLRQLQAFRMRADSAVDGAQALEALRGAAADGHPYRVAVLDQQLPDVDGLALAQEIKKDPRLAGVVLVGLTSLARPVDALTLRAAGIAQWLTKPVKQSALQEALSSAVAQSAPAPSPSGGLPPVKNKHFRVLVVEDNAMNQQVIALQLRKLGYPAEVVSNGREAVEVLGRTRYDLVLMDCHMPEMDGYAATAEIRRRESGRQRVPIVAMTAEALEGDREKCLAAGMNDYLAKPVELKKLAAVLERWDVSVDASALAGLKELTQAAKGEGGRLFQQLLTSFLRKAPERLAALRAAAARRACRDLEEEAHTLKGSAANVGAVRMVSLCQRVEQLGREGSLGDAQDLLEALEVEFGKVRAVLEKELAAAAT